MPPGAYAGALAAALRCATALPTVCRCANAACTCKKKRAASPSVSLLAAGVFRSRLLLGTEDSVAIRICEFLDSPLDQLNLSIACGRFRVKTVQDQEEPGSARAGGTDAAPVGIALAHAISVGGTVNVAAPERWSIVQEAARRWVWMAAALSEQERGWVLPRRGHPGHQPPGHSQPQIDSWLSLKQEILLLRKPLEFSWNHPSVSVAENGAAVSTIRDVSGTGVAASKVVMR